MFINAGGGPHDCAGMGQLDDQAGGAEEGGSRPPICSFYKVDELEREVEGRSHQESVDIQR